MSIFAAESPFPSTSRVWLLAAQATLSIVVSLSLTAVGLAQAEPENGDLAALLQTQSVGSNTATWGHWGPDPEKYSTWTTHSNRLVPIYTFGGNLDRVDGSQSIYRDAEKLKKLYGKLPDATLNPHADYCDQTDVFHLQQQAVADGKKRIVLFVFDGMDWETTRAAAIYKSKQIAYSAGRGTGLAFQDFESAETDFGCFVSSPHNDGTNTNVDRQIVTNPGGKTPGGYDVNRGGALPWSGGQDAFYLTAQSESHKHAYTDSAASATSMCAGIKTYNDAINVDFSGREVEPIARTLQNEGWAVGAVTSVPISHATPACAYASNVHRDDYQDLTRDMLGLPSVFHPGGLKGLDVLLGAGWGESKESDGNQGRNFVPGNRYLTAADQEKIAAKDSGVVFVQRTSGKNGGELLEQAVKQASGAQRRLFGYFGVTGGHLPFQTADGKYDPVVSVGNPATAAAEVYSPADVDENVNLAQMAMAAVKVLNAKSDRWWLMVEAGDVDWANHSNNIDNSIGALLSGEAAFEQLTRWISDNGGWDDTLVIVTADHGHYLVLDQPEMLVRRGQ